MPQSLTPEEQALLTRFRTFAGVGTLRSTNIWIIEWLSSGDRRTGQELYAWTQQRRPGWAHYTTCHSKDDVLRAIQNAPHFAKSPILHIEAHGDEKGISDGTHDHASLSWHDLTELLQPLNVATRFNLLVVVAACIGISGIQALASGPRAPAVALIGPTPKNLLDATKELYRNVSNEDAYLSDIVRSISRESGAISFEYYPFTEIAFNALIPHLIVSLRPLEKRREHDRLCNELIARGFSAEEAERRLDANPEISVATIQRIWDELFCLDIFPENRPQYGLDMRQIALAAERLNRH